MQSYHPKQHAEIASTKKMSPSSLKILGYLYQNVKKFFQIPQISRHD